MQKTEPNPSTSTPAGQERLLLASLADFWCLIEPLLRAAAPKTICEVGIGRGEFTTLLLDYCRQNDCHYSGIDPSADPALLQRVASQNAQVFNTLSLSALAGLSAQDAYILDGDHNYHTVLNELKLVLQRENHWPLVILHDVGWPWGRRDHYCSPESVPQAFRHPYSTSLGVMPGRNELGPGGFCGGESDYQYGAAEHEGGPRNGVLTAIEDFLHEQKNDEWKLLLVPSIFGLAILCATRKCAPALAEQFARLESSVGPLRGFLDLLEQNRIQLFLTYLRHITELNQIHDDYRKLAQAYQDLDKHAGALLGSYRHLETYTRSVEKTCNELRQKAQS